MIRLVVTVPTFNDDHGAMKVWEWIKNTFRNHEGVCYYKHPIVGTNSGATPEFTLLVKGYEPLAIKTISYQLDDLLEIDEDKWQIEGQENYIDSPILELDDFVIALQSKLDKERSLRRKLRAKKILALPLISQSKFKEKFGSILDGLLVIWEDGNTGVIVNQVETGFSDIEWNLARAVLQGATPLNKPSSTISSKTTKMGNAIRELDREIALLDDEQELVALQIPPGPQRIRGLAGTGKTVLLAMKAANIHRHFPEKKILFTFNTQSLYNQAKNLISKFYRVYSDVDPDWDRIQIRHAWGSNSRPGVYSDLCARQGKQPLNLMDARRIHPKAPLKACFELALQSNISPEYDFILVDEAQDFPKEFFQTLYKLALPPKQIYWAYDELQTLSSIQLPKLEDQFGIDNEGVPLVSLEGEYPGRIEKDFVLHRSYRCPQEVLMLAHALGLGLYRPQGCIQMLEKKDSWESLGYKIESGEFEKGQPVTILRPIENSPNRISDIYQGSQQMITSTVFPSREEELDWIAASIQKDIKEEEVPPEQIVVIALDAINSREHLMGIQKRLTNSEIASTIPGINDLQSAFAEPGRVTLSTVFRAKGNEAHVVYIFSFESLYDYVEEIGNRNKAFTAITRAKAWVRITGTGKRMDEAKKEVDRIIQDLPRFNFTFPDMQYIRSLDAQTIKRRREFDRANNVAADFKKLSKEVLSSMKQEDLDEIVEKINEAKSANQ